MCEPASFVVTKDRVFWSRKSDSHEDIIEEFGLQADGVRGPNIVRVEIRPPDGDMSRPQSEWVFKLDQDLIPDWFDLQDCESRSRLALADWCERRVIASGFVAEISDDALYFICGSARVGSVYGSASVGGVCGSASVGSVYGSASVGSVYGSASVDRVCGSARVGSVYGSASVGGVYGSARVDIVYGSARVDRVYGSASVGSVYGSARVGSVYGSASVGGVYDSASVGGVYDSASVGGVYDSASVDRVCGSAVVRCYNGQGDTVVSGPFAVLIDYSGPRAVCIAGT